MMGTFPAPLDLVPSTILHQSAVCINDLSIGAPEAGSWPTALVHAMEELGIPAFGPIFDS
jgi:hypothetical protein